jgi:hypothetical protein
VILPAMPYRLYLPLVLPQGDEPIWPGDVPVCD